jgi:hypothetical protein
LSLIRSRTVRRPISALRWETREKMLVGGDRKPRALSSIPTAVLV